MIGMATLAIRRKSILIVIIIVIIALAVVSAILALSPMMSDYIELPFAATQDYVYTGTGFLYLEGSAVKYYDLSDSKQNYSGILQNSDVEIAGSGRNMHVAYDDMSLSIIGLENTMLIDGVIEDVKCSDSYVACLIDKDGIDRIEVYGLAGTLLEEVTHESVVADFGFTTVGKEQLYTITLDLVSETYITTVNTYDPSIPAATGVITLQDQLIEQIDFSKKSIFIKGTDDIVRYDTQDNKESYRLMAGGYSLIDIYTNDSYAYITLKSTIEGNNDIKLYRVAQGNVASVKVLPVDRSEKYLEYAAYADNMYAFTQGSIIRFSRTGRRIETEKLKYSASEVMRLSDTEFLIISGNKLYITQIKLSNAVKAMFVK